MQEVLTMLLAYMLGSIPIGLLLTRAAGLGDIRLIGSGNIGATNVARTGNKKLAAATLIADAAKGALAIVIARILAPEMQLVAGLLAVVGHIFPVWLRFKGGKGVAPTIGVLLMLDPILCGAFLATWLGIFAYSRISSLAALTALLLLPFLAWVISEMEVTLLALLLSALVMLRHKDNIERLFSGRELTFKK